MPRGDLCHRAPLAYLSAVVGRTVVDVDRQWVEGFGVAYVVRLAGGERIPISTYFVTNAQGAADINRALDSAFPDPGRRPIGRSGADRIHKACGSVVYHKNPDVLNTRPAARAIPEDAPGPG